MKLDTTTECRKKAARPSTKPGGIFVNESPNHTTHMEWENESCNRCVSVAEQRRSIRTRFLIAVVLLPLVGGWTRTVVRASDAKPNNPASLQATTLTAEKSPPSRPIYTFRTIHDPNGIGKFYQGREIAHVMGYRAADWLDRPEREQQESLSLLIKSLKLKSGTIVADIGAGSGRISLMMAEQVGQTGKVLAIDVQQEMLDLLAKKLKRLRITNVQLVKGNQKTPRLKPATIDLVILVDVYHEFEFPYEMMREISAALKPGGRVAFVEYRKEDPTVPIKVVHKMSESQVKKEIAQPEFHLKWVETIGVLPQQHLIIFERMSKTAPHVQSNP